MSVRFLITVVVALLALIACSDDRIQVDQYDINVGIRDGDETFTVRLDTDISPDLDDSLVFTITASRMYRTNGAVIDSVDQIHAVYAGNEFALGDLREGVELVAWVDRNFDEGHMPSTLSYASLNREIWRRAGINHRLGRPWTSIEVLPELCVSVWPELERPDQLEGDAVFVHTNQLNGKKTTKILQAHVRECVRFGAYERLR